jgi:hypothetical protein
MDILDTSALTQLMDSASLLAAMASESSRSDEGWTPATILGHVSDVDEQVWHARIHLTIDAFHEDLPMPSLIWWEPDAEAIELKNRDFSLGPSIALLPEKILLHDEEHLESLR